MRFRFLATLLVVWMAASAPVLASPLAGGRSAAPEETDLNRRMAAHLKDIRDQGSVAAAAWLCLIAFAYGVLHAAGPGHGKLVVTSYFLTRRARLMRGVQMASAAAFTQALTAILLVGIPVLLLGLTRADAIAGVYHLELGSYLLMTGIGLLLLVRALRGETGCTHDHSSVPCRYHGHGLVGLRRENTSFTLMSLAVGVCPCSGAVLVLLFALANDTVPASLLAVLAMAVGVALTTSLSSLIGIGARQGLDQLLLERPRALVAAQRGLALTGAVLITLVGALLSLSTLNMG